MSIIYIELDTKERLATCSEILTSMTHLLVSLPACVCVVVVVVCVSISALMHQYVVYQQVIIIF